MRLQGLELSRDSLMLPQRLLLEDGVLMRAQGEILLRGRLVALGGKLLENGVLMRAEGKLLCAGGLVMRELLVLRLGGLTLVERIACGGGGALLILLMPDGRALRNDLRLGGGRLRGEEGGSSEAGEQKAEARHGRCGESNHGSTGDKRCFPGSTDGAEVAVARVAQAWDDVGAVVQFAIDAGGVDGNVRVHGAHLFESRGAGDEADEANPLGTAFLELVDCRGGAPAGGEHGIDENDIRLGEMRGGLEVVALRPARLLISVHADVRDAHFGEQPKHPFHHAQSGAQNGRDDDRALQDGAGTGIERGLHGARLRREVARHFVHHQRGDFGEPGAEVPGTCFCIPKLTQLHPNQGVIDNRDAGRGGSRHGLACSGSGYRCHGLLRRPRRSRGGGCDHVDRLAGEEGADVLHRDFPELMDGFHAVEGDVRSEDDVGAGEHGVAEHQFLQLAHALGITRIVGEGITAESTLR